MVRLLADPHGKMHWPLSRAKSRLSDIVGLLGGTRSYKVQLGRLPFILGGQAQHCRPIARIGHLTGSVPQSLRRKPQPIGGIPRTFDSSAVGGVRFHALIGGYCLVLAGHATAL